VYFESGTIGKMNVTAKVGPPMSESDHSRRFWHVRIMSG